MRVEFSAPSKQGSWLAQFFPGITFKVGSYSWRAIGGPDTATIRAAGSPENLAMMADMAGSCVRIYNDDGTLVWWGMIGQVEIPYGKLTISVDIEKMYNRIATAYTTVAVGESTTGDRATTAWAEDTDSIIMFGKRELLDSLEGTTALNAERRRDNKLALVKYPLAAWQSRLDGNDGDEAIFSCMGYWRTLEWMYCNIPTKLVFAYDTIGTHEEYLGRDYDDDATNTSSLAQVFDTGPAAWNILEVEVYVKKVGTPPNVLDIDICANPDDLTPGASVASGSIAVADITTAYGWVKCTFSSAYTLTANGTYFLNVSTAGMNASGYYVLMLDENQGYAQGVLRREAWDGGAWSTLAYDMPFKLYDNAIIENSQQIKNILTLYGQYFTRVHVENATGISTESYRSGDSDNLTEVETLLQTGTTTAERLLVSVSSDRAVTAYAIPSKGSYLTVDKSARFWDAGALVDSSTCPVASWVRPKELVAGSINTSRISGLDMFFLERSEYNPETKQLNFDTYGLDDLFGLVEGG